MSLSRRPICALAIAALAAFATGAARAEPATAVQHAHGASLPFLAAYGAFAIHGGAYSMARKYHRPGRSPDPIAVDEARNEHKQKYGAYDAEPAITHHADAGDHRTGGRTPEHQ
jgi:hypothetical protein